MSSYAIETPKPILLILEGGDKVGKSTVYQLLRRSTDYQPLVIDRFIGSNIVYDQFYGRESDLNKYREAETELLKIFDVYLILLVTDPDTQRVRICKEEQGIDKERALENYLKIDRLFRDYIQWSNIAHKLIIDTSRGDPQQVVNQIVNFVKAYRGEDLRCWI